jgi:hypothetical protein
VSTSAGIVRAPFLMTVEARVCRCRLAPKELGARRSLDKAVAEISGYWNVYLGFFGDQVPWLDFTVVDIRDGQVMWRNGRPPTEERQHGAT